MCVCVRMSMASLSHLLRTLFHSLPKIDVLMPSLDHHVRRTRSAYVVIRPRALHIVLSKKGGGILYSFCQCQAYNIISQTSPIVPSLLIVVDCHPFARSILYSGTPKNLIRPNTLLSLSRSPNENSLRKIQLSRPLLSGTQFRTNATVRVLGRLNKHANSVFWFVSFITMKYIVDDGACACVFLFRHLD